MIQTESLLKISDNTGARIIKCIRSIGGFNKVYSYTGDYIVGSIRELRLIKKVKKGEIHNVLITRTKKNTKYKDGSYSRFGGNAAIMVNKKKRILGNRLFGFVSKKLRRRKFVKVLLMSNNRLI